MLTALPINLDALIHARSVESPRIEFKGSWNAGPTGWQVLHSICAFANDIDNLNGGYIVLGIEEREGVAQLPPRGLEPQEIDAAQKWIRGHCNRIDPTYQPVLSPELYMDRMLLVIWAPGSDVRPHQAPTSERGERSYYVRMGSETVQAREGVLTRLMQLTARVPFDDRRALDATLDDLRDTKVREFLRDIDSSLVNEPDTREIYRKMRLCARVNGHEVPRNVGLLMFSEDPERWLPGARIEVVQFEDVSGKVIEERVFRGPVHEQLRHALQYLQSLSTAHLRKRDDAIETRGWASFPLRALRESLVNAAYHRSYDGVLEPIKVYLFADRMEITSHPGPVDGIRREHLEPGGRVPPVPARNRRIGELLKELRLAEGRGTGVPLMFEDMRINGSPPPQFDFDDARTYFRVTLPAHPEYVVLDALRQAARLRLEGERSAAVVRLQEAFEARPRSHGLARALIEELGEQEAIERARAVYERFVRATPDRLGLSMVALAWAKVLLNAGDRDAAQLVLDRVEPAELASDDVVEAAIQERRLGRQQQAHRLFSRVADHLATDVRALHEFAQTKIALARESKPRTAKGTPDGQARQALYQEARSMLERVLQLDAPPSRHAWAWFDLGRVLEALGAPHSQVRQAHAEAAQRMPGERRFIDALARLDAPRERE
jgi:ATP-dependent DNA helicase RecG